MLNIDEYKLMKFIEKHKTGFYEYPINYIYVFSNELEIDTIDFPSGDDYRIVGFNEKQSPFLIGAMVNDFKYKYAHQFKCNETMSFATNKKDGNLDMQIDFKEATLNCEYLSFFVGLQTDFD